MKDMRCTIFQNELIWLRLASTQGAVNQFDTIKVFVKKAIGNYHRQLVIRLWKWELDMSTNPFLKVSIVSAGRRYFTLRFAQFIYRKSKARIGEDNIKEEEA